MRADKFTTKFQDALGDAQSLALGKDHAYIQPEHLLAAMLRQEGGPKSLLQRAGVNTQQLAQALDAAVQRLPQVQGQEQVQPGPDLIKLLQATEKEALKRGDQFIASELFLLALEILDLGRALDFFLLELTLLCFTEGEELLLLRMGASHLGLSSFDLGAGAT